MAARGRVTWLKLRGKYALLKRSSRREKGDWEENGQKGDCEREGGTP